MFKKFLATAAALLLGIGLSFVAVAAPASATHPTVQGTVSCNPTTGMFDITWRVTGDTSYPNETATIKEVTITSSKAGETPTTTTSLINSTVKGSGFVEAVQQNATVGTNYKMTVKVQWTNHSTGDLVSKSSSFVTPTGTCTVPEDSIDCTAAILYTGETLTNGDHINIGLVQDGVDFQVNAYVDIRQSYDPPSESGLVLRINPQEPAADFAIAITNQQKNAGTFTFTFSANVTGKYTVEWAQFDSANKHFTGSLTCGSDLADAVASVTVTPPTCVAAGSLTLNTPTWATWGSYTPAVGAYSVVATAQDGHTFPADTTPGVSITNGGKTKTFTGTVLPADDQATDCDKYEVALYLYQKKDPTQPASWQNSLKQTFIASHKGTAWFTTFPTGLPDYVCGPAWGVQQDKVGNWAPEWDDNGNFVWPTNIEYPNDNIGWPPIYEAKHDNLSTVITVPACDTPTGEPKFEVKSCQVGSQNLVTLDAVLGGQWKIEQNGVVLDTYDSYTGTPAGFDEYTIRLVDKDPLDQYDVAAKSWTYTAVDPSILKCATAEDPSWAEQVCNPDGVGFTTASYTITPATGVRYEISLDDGVTFTDATPAGNDSVKTEVTSFPTKIIIKAFALPGYELVGTSEFSHIFLASADDCIDKDASASIAYNTPTCLVAGTIDVANSTLVNATWKDALPTTPGDHTVVAKANTGHAFSNGDLEQSFAVKILPTKTGPECDLPTHAIVLPVFTQTPMTCTAAGSYTLGALAPGTIDWSINGGPLTTGGTFAVTTAQEVQLVATRHDPQDGMDPAWTYNDSNNILTLKFAAPTTGCDLPTLAFTGTGVSMQLTLVGALLGLAGIGFFFVGRRLRNGQ